MSKINYSLEDKKALENLLNQHSEILNHKKEQLKETFSFMSEVKDIYTKERKDKLLNNIKDIPKGRGIIYSSGVSSLIGLYIANFTSHQFLGIGLQLTASVILGSSMIYQAIKGYEQNFLIEDLKDSNKELSKIQKNLNNIVDNLLSLKDKTPEESQYILEKLNDISIKVSNDHLAIYGHKIRNSMFDIGKLKTKIDESKESNSFGFNNNKIGGNKI